MYTKPVKISEVERKWFIVDAEDQNLGRLSSNIAKLIRGKSKVNYSPNLDMGDFVIVINSSKVKLSGNKENAKDYWRHTGYPGGQKKTSFNKSINTNAKKVITNAVKGMLPHNKLGRKLLKHLKVYNGVNHPHSAQSPEKVVFK